MKKLNFLKEKLVAHRGYHDITIGIAENSLNSFRRAVKNNYLIELDVHLLKDKSLVVFHDDNLKRACGVDKEIDSCTYAEIKNLTLFNTSSKIPLLKEVFDEVKGRVPILIETKGNNKYGELEEILLREIKAYSGLTAVQSFNPKSIYWFKKNSNTYPRGILIKSLSNGCLTKNVFKAVIYDMFLKTDFISYDIRGLPNNYVDSKRKGKIILGWTIRSKKDYEASKPFCDNFICENILAYKASIK